MEQAKITKIDKPFLKEHGRVIARAMDEHKIQKEKNMAKAEKRKETILRNAAEKELSRNY